MKNKAVKKITGMTAAILMSAMLLAGCGQDKEVANTESSQSTSNVAAVEELEADDDTAVEAGADVETDANADADMAVVTESEADTGAVDETSAETEVGAGADAASSAEPETEDAQTSSVGEQLEVRFGDEGEPFMMSLEDNETAAAIARYVGTTDWRLPIYENDADADYNVMQYYDVSSRYDIPSNPETITSEKAGEVYYSDPNRIILFYRDAEITGEYTKIGTFDPTEEFVTAVEENPVLEGWGNKIVLLTRP